MILVEQVRLLDIRTSMMYTIGMIDSVGVETVDWNPRQDIYGWCNNSHNLDGDDALPEKRQPLPIIAIGSLYCDAMSRVRMLSS